MMLIKVINENEDIGWIRYDLHNKRTVLFFLTICTLLDINLSFFLRINVLIKIPHVTFCIFTAVLVNYTRIRFRIFVFLVDDSASFYKQNCCYGICLPEEVAAGQLVLQPMRELVFMLAPLPRACNSQ